MEKSPDAFRTISEVAEWLDVPTHVLRFWESRFAQIKPVKRAGGRRYYRPSDMRLIGGVKTLLHDQGMTIRGVQKMLREQGVKHISSFSQALDVDADDADDTTIDHAPAPPPVDVFTPAAAARQTHTAEPAPEPAQEHTPVEAAADERDTDDQPDMFDEEDPDEPPAEAVDAPPPPRPDNLPPMPTFVPVRSKPRPETPVAAPTPEPEAPARPVIPDTPAVPKIDPDDDDPAFSGAPSVAARLAALPPAHLAAHRETLKAAHDRLSALRAAQE